MNNSQITWPQKINFVNALLECKNMRTTGARDEVVAQLPAEIRNNIARADANNTDVINIVEQCSEYPDGLEIFLEILDDLENGSEPVRNVIKHWDQLEGNSYRPLGFRHLKQLKHLVETTNLPKLEVSHMYRQAVPDDAKNSSSEITSTWHMLNHMNNIPPRVNHPFLIFVHLIVLELGEISLKNTLMQWSEAVANDLGNTPDDIHNLRNSLKAKANSSQQHPPYLLVVLIPHHNNRNTEHKEYNYEIFIWLNPTKSKNVARSESPIAQDQVLSYIQRELNTLIPSIGHQFSLAVNLEFFVPCELFLWDIEFKLMKPLPPTSETTSYGKMYSFVLRSQERLAQLVEPDYDRSIWHDRWHRFQELANEPLVSHLISISLSDTERSDFLDWLLYEIGSCCVGLAFAPEYRDVKKNIFLYLISAGIPVALWSRKALVKNQSTSSGEYIDGLRAIGADKALIDLPKLIQNERRQNRTQFGHELALFWDDPERLPPGYDADYAYTSIDL